MEKNILGYNLGTLALEPHKRQTKQYQNDTILQEKATKNRTCNEPEKEFVDATKQLDRRIYTDYPEIAEMYRVASQMSNSIKTYTKIPKSEYMAVLDDLKSDKFEIFASVLLKHGEISCIKDFIEK